jgi:hypothetical protein
MSVKPSSSAILHRERANKVFRNHLPLNRSRAEPRRINHQLRQFVHDLQKSTTVKEDMYVLNSRNISYILNILIWWGIVGIIGPSAEEFPNNY